MTVDEDRAWAEREAGRSAAIVAAAERRRFRDPTDAVNMLPPDVDTSDPQAVARAVRELAESKPHLVDRAAVYRYGIGTSWDGGKGRRQPPAPVDMNALIRGARDGRRGRAWSDQQLADGADLRNDDNGLSL